MTGFTPQEINGDALREDFVQKFLYCDEINWADHSMEELIDLFDQALSEAKTRWPSLNRSAELTDMDNWLAERGYIEPDLREE